MKFSLKYLLLALALCSTTAFLQAGTLDGKKILLVIELKGKSRKIDDKIVAHLQSLGATVTEMDQTEPSSKTAGMDLVILSSTVGSAEIKDKYKDVAVPLIDWESYVLKDLGMTGSERYTDYALDMNQDGEGQAINLVGAGKPLQAGLPNGKLDPYKKPQPMMEWGKPGPNAIVIGTIASDPNKACIFAYDKDAVMASGQKAPARRLMLFLYDYTFDKLNDQGLSLFDAGVAWSLGLEG